MLGTVSRGVAALGALDPGVICGWDLSHSLRSCDLVLMGHSLGPAPMVNPLG